MSVFFSKRALLILAVAVILRLGFFAAFAWHQQNFNLAIGPQDSGSFINDARNLYSGNGFSSASSAPFTPDGIRVPLVPAILGLFGSDYGWYILLQILIASLTCVIVAKLGTELFGEKVGFWTGMLLAVDPLPAFHSLLILSETWFSFFSVLGAWLLVRARQSDSKRLALVVAAGIVTGLSALTRPVGVLLIIPFAAGLLLLTSIPWKKKFLLALVFCVMFAAVIAPWAWRNQRIFGTPGLSYIAAYNWYHFNARVFYAKIHNLSNGQAKQIFLEKESEYRAGLASSNGFTLQPFYLKESWQIIAQAPDAYFVFHALNTAAVLGSSGFEDIKQFWTGNSQNLDFTSYFWRGPSGVTALVYEHPVAFAGKLAIMLCYVVIGYGFLLSWRRREQLKNFLFLATLVLLLAASTGAVAEARFRVSLEPFLVLMFVFSLLQIWHKFTRKDIHENLTLRRNFPA